MKLRFFLTFAQVVFTLLMYAIGVVVIGGTLFPSLYIILTYWFQSEGLLFPERILGLSLAIAFGYFLSRMLWIFTASAARFLLQLNVKEGVHSVGSIMMMKWRTAVALIGNWRWGCRCSWNYCR